MREVVNKGGIPNLKIKNLDISAKSGTSQAIDRKTENTQKKTIHLLYWQYTPQNNQNILFTLYTDTQKNNIRNKNSSPNGKRNNRIY